MFQRGQQSVNVKRSELLEILRKNRDQHKLDYKEAVDGYRGAKIKALEDALEKVKSEEKPEKTSLNVSLNRPINYISEYTQIIDMLEMSVDEVIKLDSDSFQAYIKDNWSWKRSFMASNASYMSSGKFSGAMLDIDD